MAKGNAIDPQDSSINDQGFKKTETDVTPSSQKEAVPNPADQYIHEPVHGENVLNQGHDEKNGNKHDQENKFNVKTHQ